MQKIALFITQSAYGHLNPNIEIADKLKTSNYSCFFFCKERFRNYIVSRNHEFLVNSTKSFGKNLEDGENIKKENSFIKSLVLRFSDHIFKTRKHEYDRLFSQINPDVIFLDTFLSNEFVILYPFLKAKGIKLFYVQTHLSPFFQPGIPPLNSNLKPEDRLWIKIKWFYEFFKRRLSRLILICKYVGFDGDSQLRKKAITQKLGERYKIFTRKILHSVFTNVPTLVTAPICLEFKAYKAPKNTYYLGKSRKSISSSEGNSLLLHYLKEKKRVGKRIIYCSLGTLHKEHSKNKSTIFFKGLVNTFKDQPDFVLILASGSSFDSINNIDYENIKILPFVDQEQILQHADIFITHGGLNSIMEGLLAKIPLIVLPLSSKYDQNGNASRVEYFGLGIQRRFRKHYSIKVMEDIRMILNNRETKKNQDVMYKKLECSNFVNLISLVNNDYFIIS